MKTITNNRTLKMVQLGLFTSIIVLMAFTPIGYIKTLGLEIALIAVPVAVGAIVMGPVSGAILGGVFGITSFIQCFGLSPFGVALLAINPVGTFIVTIIPRILMGWITGLIFVALRKNEKTKSISYAVASIASPLLNTIFFMGALVLFFYNTEYIQGIAEGLGTNNVFAFIIALVGGNILVEAVACLILGTATSKAIDIFYRKSRIDR
ncbi:ECF transporter S component [Mobilitalea sibirica]|uniref:ECF transporter S component n=1 Tax=Mobilitalea sibirica TaxID=1462919 RepID=A0A8J7H1S6_9FIRM|nr:ECF transporter S component [Mobilitalea sibirica]MBH1940453.1 ECF transporter S component [Mobilitalea sibirica]